MVARFYSALPFDEIPNVVEVAPHMPGLSDQVAFEYGLDILLIGLQAKLAIILGGGPVSDEDRDRAS